MRLESEKERLLESAPDLRVEDEDRGNGNSNDISNGSLASRTKSLIAFRAYCADLVAMLREKEAAIAETGAFIMAGLQAGAYTDARDFATSIFEGCEGRFKARLGRF